LFQYHPAYTRLRDGLFKDHRDMVFTRVFDNDTVITFEMTVNSLLHQFTEAGVVLLFSKPELVAEQLQRANEFAHELCIDRGRFPFDLQVTLAVLYVQLLFPITNNRRQARQKEIEKFLTRDLHGIWSDAFISWLIELLFVQEYANSRGITYFRFTA
jgi:hypothetical protein